MISLLRYLGFPKREQQLGSMFIPRAEPPPECLSKIAVAGGQPPFKPPSFGDGLYKPLIVILGIVWGDDCYGLFWALFWGLCWVLFWRLFWGMIYFGLKNIYEMEIQAPWGFVESFTPNATMVIYINFNRMGKKPNEEP